MSRAATPHVARALAFAVAASILTGCAPESSIAPVRSPGLPNMLSDSRAGARVGAAAEVESRAPDLGTCDSLRAPADMRVAFHAYARGVQIYRWNGASWSFVGPSATLSADAEGRSTVGIHYGGPTWESVSGSKVVAAVRRRCAPDPDAIPWLSLGAVSAQGPGTFHRIAFIQRVNTSGGNAPSTPGSVAGEEAKAPYTAEYYFYRER